MKGQAKKDFEKWFRKSELINVFTFLPWIKDKNIGIQFYDLPPSMQYGVIVDWFDSVGIEIEIIKQTKLFFVAINLKSDGITYHKTRQQARQKAIERANTIYNEAN